METLQVPESHQLTRSALKEHVVSDAYLTIGSSANDFSAGRAEMMYRCLFVTTTTPERFSELHLSGKTAAMSSPVIVSQWLSLGLIGLAEAHADPAACLGEQSSSETVWRRSYASLTELS